MMVGRRLISFNITGQESTFNKEGQKNGNQEAQEDWAVKESPQSDATKATRENEQVRQIKTTTKITPGRRGASGRYTFTELKIFVDDEQINVMCFLRSFQSSRTTSLVSLSSLSPTNLECFR